jgi:lysophospholipase L1-like esterase
MLSQTLLSSFIKGDFMTLPPNMYAYVESTDLQGIDGKQLITTDHNGFRVTNKVDYNSNDNYKIFAIGGSTTEELDIDDKKMWTHLLQEKLNFKQDVTVINTGVSGLRAKHHLATLKNIIKYKPDMAIFLIGINDWNWHIKDHINKLHGQSVIEVLQNTRMKLVINKTMLGSILRKTFYTVKKSSGSPLQFVDNDSLRKVIGSLNRDSKYTLFPNNVHSQYKDMLAQISSVCHENKIECLFITQPSGYQKEAKNEFKAGFWMTPPFEEYTLDFNSMVHIASLYNKYLIDFADNNNHQICDLASHIKPSYDLFYDDCHFNINGALKVSEILSSCITDIKNKEK